MKDDILKDLIRCISRLEQPFLVDMCVWRGTHHKDLKQVEFHFKGLLDEESTNTLVRLIYGTGDEIVIDQALHAEAADGSAKD